MSQKPDRARTIRAWLREQAAPCTLEAVTAARAENPAVVVGATPAAIAAGLGATTHQERMRTYWSIGMMFRDGILGREGSGHSMRYFVIREPKIARLSAEERRLRHNERARKRSKLVRKKGVLPWAEWNALRKQAAAARAAERAAKRAAQQAEREARFAASRKQREEAKAKAEAEKQARRYRPKPRPAMKLVEGTPKPAPPPPPRLETVAEFEARGGRIQRLPTSWESREQKAA